MYSHDHILCYIILWLRQGVIGQKVCPLALVKLIHLLICVEVISTVDDVLISIVGWKSKLGFASLKSYIKERPPSLYPIGKFGTISSWRIIEKIFPGFLVFCGWLKNVLCDWLTLFLACIGDHWWICGIFFSGSICLTGKSIWRGAHLWETSTLLFFPDWWI